MGFSFSALIIEFAKFTASIMRTMVLQKLYFEKEKFIC